jgi:hypothetical protein
MNEEIIRQSEALKPKFDSWRKKALICGLVASAFAILGLYFDREQFFRSYLLAFVYWVSLSLGSLLLLMVHHLVGGRWGFALRRLLEGGTRTLLLMFVLGIPVLLGIHELYEWSHADVVANDEILQKKAVFLNPTFFVIRYVIYFLIWGALAVLLNKWTAEQDLTTETSPTRRMQILSGPGVVVFVLITTFSAIDWIMSLEPHWFSTIYAAIFIIGQMLMTWAFMTLVAVQLSRYQPLSALLTNERLRDLGTFMLGFVMLWAYTSFSQFLIIWSGNLPEEITWYYTRLAGGWQNVGYMLVVFHFFVPMVLLVSSRLKARIPILVSIAAGLMAMRLMDLFWITAPAFDKTGFTIHWLDVVLPIAIGGLWLWVFYGQLSKRSLVPLNDPRFDFSALAAAGDQDHG